MDTDVQAPTLPELSDEQEAIAQEVIRRIKIFTDQKRFVHTTIGGYAGTGKSVLSSHIRSRLKSDGYTVDAAAYTGKATSVLRRKGVTDAQTTHRLLYKAEYSKVLRRFNFIPKDKLDCDIVLVDEGSMIPRVLDSLLSRHEIHVIYVGDHGQLEPIGEDPFNIMENPEFRLETIHRQAKDNPLIKMAAAVRTGWEPDYGLYSGIRVGQRSEFWRLIHDPTYDQIIVGFNKTRVRVNQELRNQKGHSTSDPVVGDRLICLQNNYEIGVYNGMIVTVDAVEKCSTDDRYLYIGFRDEDENRSFEKVKVRRDQFDNPNKVNLSIYEIRDGVQLFDHGLAITAHKSQGSEYNKVLVLEEIWREKWDPKRWLYTVITRSRNDLTLCR